MSGMCPTCAILVDRNGSCGCYQIPQHRAEHMNRQHITSFFNLATADPDALRDALTVLAEFVDCVDVTGGVTVNAEGLPEPAADPEWIDIGVTYVNAVAVLRRLGIYKPQ